jgi:hypothetical protein
MRIGLVIWTILATALCIGSVIETKNQQEISASVNTHAQDLHDLYAGVVELHADRLVALTDLENSTLATQAETAAVSLDSSLLASASSATSADDLSALGDVLSTLRSWQARYTLATQGDQLPAAFTVRELDQGADKLKDSIRRAHSSLDVVSTTGFIVVGIIASILGAVGFVLVLVKTAQRSHRILNIGLTIGLLAVIAIIATVGVYANKSSAIYRDQGQESTLLEAHTEIWESRAEAARNELSAISGTSDSPQSHLNTARRLITSLDVPEGKQLIEYLAAIEKTFPEQQFGSIEPWRNASTQLRDIMEANRPLPDQLIVDITGYIANLFLMGIVAVIGLLAGISTRTKEYR